MNRRITVRPAKPPSLSVVALWLGLAVFLFAARDAAHAQIVVYQNTTTTTPSVRYSTTEFGDEIVLDGKQARTIYDFGFDYFGDFAEGTAATAIFRIYRNDGADVDPSDKTLRGPGTLLYESDPIAMHAGYHEATVDGLGIAVPASFTWTVTFVGLTGAEGNRAGLLFENPPTVGSSFDDYWEKRNNVWGIYRFGGAPVANFGAIFRAIADPVALPQFSNITIPPNSSTADVPFALVITVENLGDITVTGESDNPLLVPNSAIVVSGTGQNRSFKITPTRDRTGVANITIKAATLTGFVATSSFVLQVTDGNNPLAISFIPDQQILAGQSTTNIPFQVFGLDTQGGFDRADFTSSNKTLVPDFNIVRDGDVNTGKFTVQVTPAAGQAGQTTISMTFRARSGASTTSTFNVTVNPRPQFAILTKSLATSSLGQAYSAPLLTTNGTAPLAWSLKSGNLPGGLALAANTGIISGTPTNMGVFPLTVSVKDATNNTADQVLTLTVLGVPFITTQPAGLTIDAGKDAEFAVEVAGTAPFFYRWYFAGTALAVTNSSLKLVKVTPAQAGDYAVVITNFLGATTSHLARLLVTIPGPSLLADRPAAGVLQKSYSYQLKEEYGTPPLAWVLKDGSLPSGVLLNPATGLLSGAPTSGGVFDFSVEVTDADKRSARRNYRLEVFRPPAITSQPEDVSVMDGKNASFAVTATGTASLKYQWFFNGSPQAKGTSAKFDLGKVSSAQAGDYAVVIANDYGAVTSRVAKLAVTAPVLEITSPSLIEVPVARSFFFTFQSFGGAAPLTWSITSGELPPGLEFQPASGTIRGTTTNLGVFDLTVSVRDGAGRQATQPLTVAVVSRPVITEQPADVSAVEGGGAQFTVVTDGSRPFFYQWFFSNAAINGQTNDTLQLNNLELTQAGGYSVAISNLLGAVTSRVATLSIGASPPRLTKIPASAFVNEAFEFQFAAAKGTPPYRWSLAPGTVLPPGLTLDHDTGLLSGTPTGRGVYEVVVRVTDNDDTINDVVLYVTVESKPFIVSQPVAATVKLGEDAAFAVSAKGSGPRHYQWRFNGLDLPDTDRRSLQLKAVQVAQQGDFQVVISNSFGSVTSQVARLTVLVPPQIVTHPPTQAVPIGSTVVFTVGVTGTGPFNYQWLLNGATIAGETNAALGLSNVQPADSGSFSVRVQNAFGTATSRPALLTVTVPTLTLANNFADRLLLAPGGGAGRGSNTNADLENGEPNHGGVRGGKSVWAAWKAPADGIAAFSTRGSSFDTTLAVYTGDDVRSLAPVVSDKDGGGFFTSAARFNAKSNVVYQIAVDGFGGQSGDILLTWSFDAAAPPIPIIVQQPVSLTVVEGLGAQFEVVAANPPGINGPLVYQWYQNDKPLPQGTGSLLTINAAGPVQLGLYYCVVGNGLGLTTSEAVSLQLQTTSTDVIDSDVSSEDKFFSATQSSGALPARITRGLSRPAGAALARGYTGTQIFNSYGSSTDAGEPDHCGVLGGASQWFSYLAESDGELTITTAGSDFDTVLAVYTGPGTDFESLVLVSCDDNGGGDGISSMVRFDATKGTVYYVAVDGVNGATGNVKLTHNLLGTTKLTLLSAPPVIPFLSLPCQIGRNYSIQVSSNLVDWAELFTTNATAGTINFTDPTGPVFHDRYYRVVINP